MTFPDAEIDDAAHQQLDAIGSRADAGRDASGGAGVVFDRFAHECAVPAAVVQGGARAVDPGCRRRSSPSAVFASAARAKPTPSLSPASRTVPTPHCKMPGQRDRAWLSSAFGRQFQILLALLQYRPVLLGETDAHALRSGTATA